MEVADHQQVSEDVSEHDEVGEREEVEEDGDYKGIGSFISVLDVLL